MLYTPNYIHFAKKFQVIKTKIFQKINYDQKCWLFSASDNITQENNQIETNTNASSLK